MLGFALLSPTYDYDTPFQGEDKSNKARMRTQNAGLCSCQTNPMRQGRYFGQDRIQFPPRLCPVGL